MVHMKTLENGERGYYFSNWVPGIIEDVLANKKLVEKYPIISECFEEYTRKRF